LIDDAGNDDLGGYFNAPFLPGGGPNQMIEDIEVDIPDEIGDNQDIEIKINDRRDLDIASRSYISEP